MTRILVTGGLGAACIGHMLAANGKVIGVITGIESAGGRQLRVDLEPIPERFTVRGSFTAHFVADDLLAQMVRTHPEQPAPRWQSARPYLKRKKGRS